MLQALNLYKELLDYAALNNCIILYMYQNSLFKIIF